MTHRNQTGGRPNRRSVLKAFVSTSGVAGLAGCSFVSDDGPVLEDGGADEGTALEGTPDDRTPTEVDTEIGSTATPTDSPTPRPTDFPTPDFTQDCLDLDPDRIEIKEDGEGWLIVQGAQQMLGFDEFEHAKKARNLIQHYGFTLRCFVGRPDPGMIYWLVEGSPPKTGAAPTDMTEDCLDLDPDRIEIKEDGESWLIVQGAQQMLGFDEFEHAKKARNLIQHYGFAQHCFVGRPAAGMRYWLADGEA